MTSALFPGRHRFTITADGFAEKIVNVDIVPGEITDIEVRMTR